MNQRLRDGIEKLKATMQQYNLRVDQIVPAIRHLMVLDPDVPTNRIRSMDRSEVMQWWLERTEAPDELDMVFLEDSYQQRFSNDAIGDNGQVDKPLDTSEELVEPPTDEEPIPQITPKPITPKPKVDAPLPNSQPPLKPVNLKQPTPKPNPCDSASTAVLSFRFQLCTEDASPASCPSAIPLFSIIRTTFSS